MNTILTLVCPASLFLLIACGHKPASTKNNILQKIDQNQQNTSRFFQLEPCCKQTVDSGKREKGTGIEQMYLDYSKENDVVNCQCAIDEGRNELKAFIMLFEDLADSVSDEELLNLGIKHLEVLGQGGLFTPDQINAATEILHSSSVIIFVNCTQKPAGEAQQKQIGQHCYRPGSVANESYFF